MLRAQGNSGGYILGILRSSPDTSSKTFIFLVLPEIPGSYLFLVNGQDFKKSKTGGVPGARGGHKAVGKTLGEKEISSEQLIFLFSTPLYFVKPFLPDCGSSFADKIL